MIKIDLNILKGRKYAPVNRGTRLMKARSIHSWKMVTCGECTDKEAVCCYNTPYALDLHGLGTRMP